VIDAAELVVEEDAWEIELVEILIAEDTAGLVAMLLVGDTAITTLELLLLGAGAEAEGITGLLVAETVAVDEVGVCDVGIVEVEEEGMVELSE
jgi:malic enzyme